MKRLMWSMKRRHQSMLAQMKLVTDGSPVTISIMTKSQAHAPSMIRLSRSSTCRPPLTGFGPSARGYTATVLVDCDSSVVVLWWLGYWHPYAAEQLMTEAVARLEEQHPYSYDQPFKRSESQSTDIQRYLQHDRVCGERIGLE